MDAYMPSVRLSSDKAEPHRRRSRTRGTCGDRCARSTVSNARNLIAQAPHRLWCRQRTARRHPQPSARGLRSSGPHQLIGPRASLDELVQV